MSMKPAKSVDHDEAYRQVGRFMSAWAFLESQLNVGIRTLSGLDSMESAIITANMQVRDKINALRTLLVLFSLAEDEKAAGRLMAKIENMSKDRNTVAHTMFWPQKKGSGVEFSRIKARGKLETLSVVWSTKQFDEKVARMHELQDQLKDAVKSAAKLRRAWLRLQASTRPKPNLSALSGLTIDPTPTEGSRLQGLVGLLSFHIQEPLSSQPTTSEIAPQTLEAPLSKPKIQKKSEKK